MLQMTVNWVTLSGQGEQRMAYMRHQWSYIDTGSFNLALRATAQVRSVFRFLFLVLLLL